MTTVDDAFRWARIHAVRHMAACEEAGLRWGETSLTEVVTSHAASAVTVVPFTQRAEALSGADWVWWWVDSRGAYGMLVQAKRLTVGSGKWRFDFRYPNSTGTQRSTLMGAAGAFGLLPVYALYLGTGTYRTWAGCSDGHRSGRCLQCVKRSLMPALLADTVIVDNPFATYERSVALEDVWDPPESGAMIIPSLREQMTPELSDFLTTPQVGSRAVTRAMTDLVLHARFAQFADAVTGVITVRRNGAHDRLGPVFNRVPDDRGH